MKKHITKFLILTIILTAALSVNYLFAAWTGPTQAPPGGNTPTPIHTGSTPQIKEGGLSLSSLLVSGGAYFQGNVGVGVEEPTETLDISGGIKVGNTSSANAGTIRWTGADFQGYMGGDWVSLTGAGLVCTSFTYSAWGECQSNSTQTRIVTSSSPSGCVGGNPITTQSCTYTEPMSTQCINAGGSWENTQNTCYFSGTSCLSGWSPNASHSSTIQSTCTGGRGQCWLSPPTCTTADHYRSNIARETCSYSAGYYSQNRGRCKKLPKKTCTAFQTEIGCTKN
ncbi:MAG: hypothetical protein QGG63_01765 [Candidatus Pacebacteria bacterium]|jgi:hypothetical protein|nr:hypothetical protein [Candidatus Paceibacterota bacterium]